MNALSFPRAGHRALIGSAVVKGCSFVPKDTLRESIGAPCGEKRTINVLLRLVYRCTSETKERREQTSPSIARIQGNRWAGRSNRVASGSDRDSIASVCRDSPPSRGACTLHPWCRSSSLSGFCTWDTGRASRNKRRRCTCACTATEHATGGNIGKRRITAPPLCSIGNPRDHRCRKLPVHLSLNYRCCCMALRAPEPSPNPRTCHPRRSSSSCRSPGTVA